MSRNVLQKENRMQESLALSFCSGCIKKSASLKLELYGKIEGNPKAGKRFFFFHAWSQPSFLFTLTPTLRTSVLFHSHVVQRGLVRSTAFRGILKPGIRRPEFRNVLSILSRQPSCNYCKSPSILVGQRIKIVKRNVSLCYKLTSVSSLLVLADDMFKDSSHAVKTML